MLTSDLRLARTARFFSAAALTATMLLASAAVAAVAEDVDGISGNPSDGNAGDQRSRFSYELSPGQEISDFYLAKNTGTTDQVLTVFATDAYNTDDGGYALLDTGEDPIDAGSWVSFEAGADRIEVPLAAGSSKVVPFTLEVPADARPGDHAAGIVISVASGSGQVVLDRRVATRLYVRVAGDLQPALSVANFIANYEQQLNPLDGTTTITATVRNTGNVALGGKVVVGVNALFGIPVGTAIQEDVAELLPGSERTLSYQVLGVGQVGYVNPYMRLLPTSDPDAPPPGPLLEIQRDVVLWAIPWWLLAIILVAAALAFFVRIRGKRDESAAKAWIEYTEAEARRKALEKAPAVTSSSSS